MKSISSVPLGYCWYCFLKNSNTKLPLTHSRILGEICLSSISVYTKNSTTWSGFTKLSHTSANNNNKNCLGSSSSGNKFKMAPFHSLSDYAKYFYKTRRQQFEWHIKPVLWSCIHPSQFSVVFLTITPVRKDQHWQLWWDLWSIVNSEPQPRIIITYKTVITLVEFFTC